MTPAPSREMLALARAARPAKLLSMAHDLIWLAEAALADEAADDSYSVENRELMLEQRARLTTPARTVIEVSVALQRVYRHG